MIVKVSDNSSRVSFLKNYKLCNSENDYDYDIEPALSGMMANYFDRFS